MDRTEVLAGMRAKAGELLGLDPAAMTEQASLVDDLQVDSLDLVEYVMALEDLFEVELPEDELSAATNVGELADIVTGKTTAGRPV